MMKKVFVLSCLALLSAALPLRAQDETPAPLLQDESFGFIGLKIDELYRRLGPPKSVHTARGDESWQDDVVFTYSEGDFYIYRDRVWQVEVKALHGIKVGDPKQVALLVLREHARDRGDYLSYVLPGGAWPLSVRINFDANRINRIFIFRPDY